MDYQGPRAATAIIRRRAIHHLGCRGLGACTPAVQIQLRRPGRTKGARSCSTGIRECWHYSPKPLRRRSTTDPARPLTVCPDAHAGVTVNKQASKQTYWTDRLYRCSNPSPPARLSFMFCRPPSVFVVNVSLRVWRENSFLTALIVRRLILSEIL